MSASIIRILDFKEAGLLMASVKKYVDTWGRVANSDAPELAWVNFKSPQGARELLVFCQTIVSWLPKGQWRILQINNFNNFQAPAEFQLARTLLGPDVRLGGVVGKTVLIENAEQPIDASDLLVADLIYLFLLHEGHADLVSSDSIHGEYIGIQDGFVYFYSTAPRLLEAENAMRNFFANPYTPPDWVLDVMARFQIQSEVQGQGEN